SLPVFDHISALPTVPTRRSSDLVSSAEAEGIKRAHGLDYHAPPEMQEAVSIIGELSRSQVEAIRNTIMFYTSNQPQYSVDWLVLDRKSTRLNSSHVSISYAVFCL